MRTTRLDLAPSLRIWVRLILYSLQLTASLWLAYELRFDFVLSHQAQYERLIVLVWLVPVQLILLGLFQQLTPLLGYFSTPDLARIFHALTISVAIASGIWIFAGAGYSPPRSVMIIDF